jgi:hypothetical protein
MKNLTTKLMIAAATLVASVGMASAQTMEAKIPFAFRADGKVFAAGTYRIQMMRTAGSPIVAIKNVKNGGRLVSLASPNGGAKSAWQSSGAPVLEFRCGVSRCALTNMWMGGSESTYRLPTPSLGKDEPVHTAEIVMHPAGVD